MQIFTDQRERYTEESGATLFLAGTEVPPKGPTRHLAQPMPTSFVDPSHPRNPGPLPLSQH